MKKIILPVALLVAVFIAFPAPEAKAMDPVTIALLTPVAIKVAQTASPYVIRGLINAGKGMIKVGKDMIDIFRLPLGLFQATLLAPFGQFKSGCRNLFKGGIAPVKMTLHTLLLPVLLTGVNMNFN
jgi:hypothetical protein